MSLSKYLLNPSLSQALSWTLGTLGTQLPSRSSQPVTILQTEKCANANVRP